jgi:hypothetical protein
MDFRLDVIRQQERRTTNHFWSARADSQVNFIARPNLLSIGLVLILVPAYTNIPAEVPPTIMMGLATNEQAILLRSGNRASRK